MNVMIKSVSIVDGSTIASHWDEPMVVVEVFGMGMYVAHRWTAPIWGSMIGNDVWVNIEPCKSNPAWNWIKFRDDQSEG